MPNEQRRKRIKILKDQLSLINLYPEAFIEGLEKYINEILDELNYHRNQLQN